MSIRRRFDVAFLTGLAPRVAAVGVNAGLKLTSLSSGESGKAGLCWTDLFSIKSAS